MSKSVSICVAVALALSPVAGNAASGIFGTMANFDVFNDHPTSAYEGAELELEGLSMQDVTETYTWHHFPSKSVSVYTLGATSGVRIRYSSFDGTSFAYAVAPRVGATSTSGHFCVSIPGCEHFGFSVSKQPTATRYYWLDHPASGTPDELVRAAEIPMAIPTPIWSYIAPAGNNRAQVVAEIRLPDPPDVVNQKADAVWVKVFKIKTDVVNLANLNDLISGNNQYVPQGETQIETEWKMLENGKPLVVKADVIDGARAIIRRYETYKYTGPVDAENEPLCLDGNCDAPNLDSNLGPVELGAFVGAQMAAANLAPIPEPRTYALMLAGLGLVAGVQRYRRRAHRAV